MQNSGSEVLELGEIVKENDAIFVGILPITEKRSQETGVFVVLPYSGTLVCEFNELAEIARKLNRKALQNEMPMVQVPSIETMQVILDNRGEGELKKVFNEYGLNSGLYPEGYIWTSKSKKIEKKPGRIVGREINAPIINKKYQVRPFDMDVAPNFKWVPASGLLAYHKTI